MVIENSWALIVFMLASPFAGVGLFFFTRGKRKEHKALKQAIKSGVWQQNINYKFQGKYKIKLDKKILKLEIKNRKKLNKIEADGLSKQMKENEGKK